MRGGPYRAVVMRELNRRIVMSPPQSFLDTSALNNPPSGQLDNPVVFSQNGQAAIIGDQAVLGQLVQQPQIGLDQPAAQQVPPVEQPAAADQTQSLAQTLAVQQTTDTPTPLAQSLDPSTTIPTSVTDSIATTSLASHTSAFSSLSSSDPSALSATWTSSSLPSITSSTTSPDHHRAFTHTPLFIVIIVLSSLVLLALIATLMSTIYRRSCCFPCRRRKDDDGLSDVVYSFHSHSRSNTLSQMGSLSALGLSGPSTFGIGEGPGIAGIGMGAGGMDTLAEKEGVQRRATMLANHPEQSAFLHSGQGEFPVLHDITDVRDEWRIHSPRPGTHGEMWQVPLTPVVGAQEGHEVESVAEVAEERALEIRNWSPGDLDGRSSILTWANQAASGAPPRDVEGMAALSEEPNEGSGKPRCEQDNLSRSSSTRLSVPYLPAPDPRDYVPASFISPADTVVDLNHPGTRDAEKAEAETPSRAGTWASNLRDTLFAAIQGIRPTTEDVESDAYTRSPSPPSQSRRSVHRFLSRSSRRSGDAEAIAGYFLTPSLSSSTTASRVPSAGPRTAPVEYVSKLETVGAGERYKRDYGRPQAVSDA